MARNPVLILEGDGDREAIPYFIRTVSEHQIFPTPRPILKQNVPRLSREGELERFAKLALLREDADSALFLLDVDEACAKEIVENWVPRLNALHPRKKIGIGLFVPEFESYFLACLDLIVEGYPTYGWSLADWNILDDHEAHRGTKELISRRMRKGKRYKETLDQARFVSKIDSTRLHGRCRSFRHIENLITWLLADNVEATYPVVGGVEIHATGQ